MPRGYGTFEHTADIGIRAWGNEFSEVFEEAAKALFSVIVDLETVSPRQKLKVELTSPLTHTLSPAGRGQGEGYEELFLAWLKELLFIFETKHILLSRFKILDLSTTHLSAEAEGEPIDNKKHALGKEVKAITHHQFKLIRDKSRYLAEVILDI